jgi:hypothetical protein
LLLSGSDLETMSLGSTRRRRVCKLILASKHSSSCWPQDLMLNRKRAASQRRSLLCGVLTATVGAAWHQKRCVFTEFSSRTRLVLSSLVLLKLRSEARIQEISSKSLLPRKLEPPQAFSLYPNLIVLLFNNTTWQRKFKPIFCKEHRETFAIEPLSPATPWVQQRCEANIRPYRVLTKSKQHHLPRLSPDTISPLIPPGTTRPHHLAHRAFSIRQIHYRRRSRTSTTPPTIQPVCLPPRRRQHPLRSQQGPRLHPEGP